LFDKYNNEYDIGVDISVKSNPTFGISIEKFDINNKRQLSYIEISQNRRSKALGFDHNIIGFEFSDKNSSKIFRVTDFTSTSSRKNKLIILDINSKLEYKCTLSFVKNDRNEGAIKKFFRNNQLTKLGI